MTAASEPSLIAYSLLRRNLRNLADQETDSVVLASLHEADKCLTYVITYIARNEAEQIIQEEAEKDHESV